MILWGWPLVRSCTVNADQWWGYEQKKGSENSSCSLLNTWLSQSYFSPLSLNMRRVRSQCFPPKMNQTAGVKATWEKPKLNMSVSCLRKSLLFLSASSQMILDVSRGKRSTNWIRLLNHLISRSLRSLTASSPFDVCTNRRVYWPAGWCRSEKSFSGGILRCGTEALRGKFVI